MAYYDYPRVSPYAETPQYSWRIGRYVHRSIPVSSTDQTILVSAKYHNRPDRLSQDLYGTPAYWWVFMVRNMDLIRDPIWDLKAGMKIVVPSAQTISSVLGG